MEEQNECAYCGELCGDETFCQDCKQQVEDGFIIQDEDGEWVKNVIKGNEHKFYDENKLYKVKYEFMTEKEQKLFKMLTNVIDDDYLVFPQVTLQSFIRTNTYTRNDELYRTPDFLICLKEEYKPVLVIELNGYDHYTNNYKKARDESVKNILDKAGLPLLTINNEDLYDMTQEKLKDLIYSNMKK